MSLPSSPVNHYAKTHSSGWISIFLFGAVWLWSVVASAQAQDPAAARALFLEARKAAAANDYATACPKFTESYKFEPAVGTLLNLADCNRRQGRIATAWSSFQTALEQLAMKDERRPAVERVVAELEKRLPKLSVGLKPGAPPQATLERDGVQVGNDGFGVPIPVDPGRHIVVVRVPGRKDQSYTVELAEAESKEILGEAGPASPTPGAAAPKPTPLASTFVAAPKPEARGKSHTAAYVVGGIGVAGIAVGVVTRVLAFGQQSTIDNSCPNKGCDGTGWDAISKAKTLQTVSAISLIAGTAALGVGIYLGVAGGDRVESPRASLHPLVMPGGGGVTLLRRF